QLVLVGPLISPLSECSNGSRGGGKHVDMMSIDDVPKAVEFRKVRSALIHQRSRPILQWTVDDIAVAGDPSNISGAPVRIFFFQIKNPFRGEIRPDRIATCGVHDSLRLPRGPRCVKDVEGMFGVQGFAGTVVRRFRHEFVPPMIAARLHVYCSPCALVNYNALY